VKLLAAIVLVNYFWGLCELAWYLWGNHSRSLLFSAVLNISLALLLKKDEA
jgi:hypothetical protein